MRCPSSPFLLLLLLLPSSSPWYPSRQSALLASFFLLPSIVLMRGGKTNSRSSRNFVGAYVLPFLLPSPSTSSPSQLNSLVLLRERERDYKSGGSRENRVFTHKRLNEEADAKKEKGRMNDLRQNWIVVEDYGRCRSRERGIEESIRSLHLQVSSISNSC